MIGMYLDVKEETSMNRMLAEKYIRIYMKRNLGLSQILCKHRNAVQIEQNIFKVEVVQAAAALFSK